MMKVTVDASPMSTHGVQAGLRVARALAAAGIEADVVRDNFTYTVRSEMPPPPQLEFVVRNRSGEVV